MIAHVRFSRDDHILVETPAGAVDTWNDHVVALPPSHYPCSGITGMKMIHRDFAVFCSLEGSNEFLTVLVLKVLDIALSQFFLLQPSGFCWREHHLAHRWRG